MQIEEQVGEKGIIVGTHRNADGLLKNAPTKHNKCVVNQKLKHFDDITFRLLFGRIRVSFFCEIKLVPSLDMVFVSTLDILFFMKNICTHYFNLSFSFESGIAVERTEKSNILMSLEEGRYLDSMYSNKSLEFSESISDSYHPLSS